jgi:hypothetical protein
MSKIAACVTMEGPFPEGFWFIGCRRGRRLAQAPKTRLTHLTTKQLPPSPFTRSQSAAASALDKPATRSR